MFYLFPCSNAPDSAIEITFKLCRFLVIAHKFKAHVEAKEQVN